MTKPPLAQPHFKRRFPLKQASQSYPSIPLNFQISPNRTAGTTRVHNGGDLPSFQHQHHFNLFPHLHYIQSLPFFIIITIIASPSKPHHATTTHAKRTPAPRKGYEVRFVSFLQGREAQKRWEGIRNYTPLKETQHQQQQRYDLPE